MRNLVKTPSFETDTADWVWTSGAVRTNLGAYDGTWSALVVQAVGYAEPGKVTQAITVVPGATYQFSMYLNKVGAAGASFRFRVDPGTGSFDTTHDLAPGAFGSGWQQWKPPSVRAIGPNARIRFTLVPPLSPTRYWLADLITMERAVAVTKALKDALIADLEYVTVANGYTYDVGTVSGRTIRHDEATTPAAWVTAGSGGLSQPHLLSNREGYATQRYLVALLTSDAQDMDLFLDDCANAVERTESNLFGVQEASYQVEMVTAVEWASEETDTDTGQGNVVRRLAVDVTYHYLRGDK